MCLPPIVTAAIIGAGAIAYSSSQQSRAAAATREQQERIAEMNRQWQAEQAEAERAFQSEMAELARAAERSRVEMEREWQAESLAAQKSWQEQQMLFEQQQQQADMAFQQSLADQQRQMFEAQQAATRAEAERQRQAELSRQNNITAGQGIISEMFGQFDDGFYDQRSQSYIDFATPQLDEQYQDAMQNLVRSLSRGGNLNSSVRAQAVADLQEQYDEGLSLIQSRANQYANDARSAIEASRGNLIAQNAQLADPGAVRTLAQSQISTLGQDPSFSPLSSLISALQRSGTGTTEAKREETPAVELYGAAPSTETGKVVS